MTKLRLDERDDLMHPVDDAPNFNESMYFNVYDATARAGGFFRIGNRPNEGYAEVTCCLYLPDGRAAFTFARPSIGSNASFDAGGMRFDIVEPMKELRVAFDGPLALLADPLEMADPKRAFSASPWVPSSIDLAYEAVAPAHGGEPPEGAATNEFARGHYVQHVAARGTIRVGEQEWPVDGFGLRDHSWGPRWWQSPLWYRWLTCTFDREHGFLVSVIGARDGTRRTGGIVFMPGSFEEIVSADIVTEYDGGGYHRALRAHVRTENHEHKIEGRVLSLIPLRNRREGLLTRISEGLTEWRSGPLVGHGLAEYLDQIVDGRPAGNGEA